MDELAKAMKVIKLKDEEYGQYLTAGEDQVSVILTKPNTEGYNPKSTEWRLQWLKSPKGLVGQVRLWSIYNKVLTLAEDPANYYLNTLTDALTQQSWPPSNGGEAASEWRFELREKNNVALVGDLFKRSKRFCESLVLNAKSPGIDNKSRFIFNSFYRKTLFRWLNCNSWLVEVVVEDNDSNKLTTSSVNQKISTSPEQPRMQRQVSTNKAVTSFETGKSPMDQDTKLNTSATPPEQPLMQRQVSTNKTITSFETSKPSKNDQERTHSYPDKSPVDQDTKLNTSVKQETPTPPEQPLIQSPVSNKLATSFRTSTPVKNNQESYNHRNHDKSSVKQKTSTPPEQPPMHSNYGARSNIAGQLRDNFMNTLSRWQVGQVYLHVSPTSNGFHTSAGYKYAQYTNSGNNVNGSGVQKNGDVSLHSEINRSRDNNAKFVNYDDSDY